MRNLLMAHQHFSIFYEAPFRRAHTEVAVAVELAAGLSTSWAEPKAAGGWSGMARGDASGSPSMAIGDGSGAPRLRLHRHPPPHGRRGAQPMGLRRWRAQPRPLRASTWSSLLRRLPALSKQSWLGFQAPTSHAPSSCADWRPRLPPRPRRDPPSQGAVFSSTVFLQGCFVTPPLETTAMYDRAHV